MEQNNNKRFLQLLKDAKNDGGENIWTDYFVDNLSLTHKEVNNIMFELRLRGLVNILVDSGIGGICNCEITDKGLASLE